MAGKAVYSVKTEIELALWRLLEHKTYTDISVTDVVKEAKVARTSFYRNFSSVSDVLDSITDQTVEMLNLEIMPLIAVTNDRKLREFLFNYFYQVSINCQKMQALGGINNTALSSRLKAKLPQKFAAASSETTISERYGWVGKLCLLDGIARQWISSGMQETPEEMIDYVTSVIKAFQ